LQINAAHDGTIDDPLLVGPLARLWSVTLPEWTSYPIIARDIVVVVTATGGDGSQAQMWAFHGHTGVPAWGPINLGVGTALTWTAGFGAVTYENGRVFTTQTDGTVRAFDILTGDLIWSTPADVDAAGFDFRSSPSAYGGIVYMDGMATGGLTAIDEASGQILWQVAPEPDLTSGSDPAITSDGVFVSHACASTSRYDRLSGAKLWETWGGGCASGGGAWTPVVAGGLVYARQEDDPTGAIIIPTYLLDVTTGSDAGAFLSGPPPAVHAGHTFVVSGGHLSSVVQLDQRTAWTFGDGTLVTPPIVVSGRVFIGSSTGTLYAVDETTGAQVWSDVVGAAFGGIGELSLTAPRALAAAGGLLVAPVGNSLFVYGVDADAGAVDGGGDGGRDAEDAD
jgi:outer membrane protein assembly factor BamB